jgi:hypothetical protein
LPAVAAPAQHRPHHPGAIRPAGRPRPTWRSRRPAPTVDPVRYGQRGDRRLKQHRAITTRHDKLAVSYHTWLVLAALL